MTTGEIQQGICSIPPPGWECTRGHNHEGPCRARPRVDTKPKHIDCESYTNAAPAFMLYVEQSAAIKTWKIEHCTQKHGGPNPYGGAIGGRFTYSFTPTSIGEVVTVHCSCGEAIDVSDYPQW